MEHPHNQDNIDDIFRDALRSGERTPAAPIWQKIETQLDKDRRYRSQLWWRPIAIAALFLLVVSGFWLLRNSRRPAGSVVFGRHAAKGPVPRSLEKGQITTLSSPKARIAAEKGARIAAERGTRIAAEGGTRISAEGGTKIAVEGGTRISAEGGTKIAVEGGTRIAADRQTQSDLFFLSEEKSGHVPFAALVLPRVTAPDILTKISQSHSAPGGLIRARAGQHRPDLTVYISQELAGYSLADHDSSGAHGQDIEKRETTNFSRSVGFLISYHLHHHWVVGLGLDLSRSVTTSDPGKVVAVQDNNGKTSFLVTTVTGYGYVASAGIANIGDTATTGKITGKLDYIDLPVILSRQWSIGRFSLLAGAGLDGKLLTHATIETSITGPAGVGRQNEVTQYGLRKFDPGWQVKGECRYQLTRSYAATVMAMFKSSVGPVNIHTSYSTYPYNFGMGIGITRTF